MVFEHVYVNISSPPPIIELATALQNMRIYIYMNANLGFRKNMSKRPKANAVYSIRCGDCEKVYLGQTKRQFCSCLREHQRAASNSNTRV